MLACYCATVPATVLLGLSGTAATLTTHTRQGGLPTTYLLLTSHESLLASHYSLLTTSFLLLTTHYFLQVMHVFTPVLGQSLLLPLDGWHGSDSNPRGHSPTNLSHSHILASHGSDSNPRGHSPTNLSIFHSVRYVEPILIKVDLAEQSWNRCCEPHVIAM